LRLFKSLRYLFPIALLVVFIGCATQQAVPDKNGITHVPGRFIGASHDEFKFTDGTVITNGNPDVTHWAEVKYSDGAEISIHFQRDFGYGQDTWAAFDKACAGAARCPLINYEDRLYAVAPLDERDWMDSETWMLIAFDEYDFKNAIKYQACRDNHYYSAADSKTLMDVVDKVETNPTGAKSDPEVTKHLVTDDALLRRLPVCDWRRRIGIEAVYPPPPNEGKAKIVPASHTRPGYAEAKGDKGIIVDVYFSEDRRRLDRVVFKSPKASFSYRPVYNESDCPTLDRCEHAVTGPLKQPDRFDLHSLDDEPLSQSRIFEVDDTVGGIKSYHGCAGGRLYTGKNRDQVEREVKEALENPAPPPVKGAPVLGAPETSESGDTVIPDAFCDWTYRRKQAQALMKSQGAQ
jgi:hypothetical protein